MNSSLVREYMKYSTMSAKLDRIVTKSIQTTHCWGLWSIV